MKHLRRFSYLPVSKAEDFSRNLSVYLGIKIVRVRQTVNALELTASRLYSTDRERHHLDSLA